MIEVVAAVSIAGIAATATASHLATAIASLRTAEREEAVMATADRLMAELCLLERIDLDRRIGRHQVGLMEAAISRPERELYRIAITPAGP